MSESTLLAIGFLSAPLWLTAILLLGYLIVVLCTVCVDGLVYFVQNTLGIPWSPGREVRLVLIPFALPLFPIAMSVEMVLLFVSRSARVSLTGTSWLFSAFLALPRSLIFVFLLVWLAIPGALLWQHGSLDFDEGGVVPTWMGLGGLWLFAPIATTLMVHVLKRLWPQLLSLLQVTFGGRLFKGQGFEAKLGIGPVGGSAGIFESFVGLRYLKAKKDQSFISVITLISVAGVMVGVCALIVVLSVMSGFEEDLKQKILGTNSHVIVLRYGGEMLAPDDVRQQVMDIDGVIGATPFIYSEAMLTTDSQVSGVVLKGLEADTVGSVTDLVGAIKYGLGGELLDQESKELTIRSLEIESDVPGILLGEELAQSLRVSVGDVLNVVSPLGEVGPLGTRVPKFKKFKVNGIFHTGMYEYDSKFSYVSIASAQKFLSMNGTVTGLELKVDDIYAAATIADNVEKVLGYPHWTRDWMQMNKNLFSALWLEKIVMGIILTMIVGVAALNIISTLIMLVIEKGKEIAILKAMGASELQVMKVFMIEGVVIGFTGTTLGCFMGLMLCTMLANFDLIRLNPDVYYLDSLPVKISGMMFLMVALVAMAVSFLATIYPSWRASRMDPVEGLRYE